MLSGMLQVEPDRPGWCVRDTVTGEYRARRFSREAADAMVDEWVRDHADRVVPREGVQVQTPPLASYWEVSFIVAWARLEGRWWACVGEPQRWVPAELVRVHHPMLRKKRW